MSRQEEIKRLIVTHQRRLHKLKDQQASFGLYSPPYILTEIEDVEAEIENLQEELEALREIRNYENVIETSSGRVDIYRVRAIFSEILGIAHHQITVRKEQAGVLWVEVPVRVAERLVDLSRQEYPAIQALAIQQIRIVHKPPAAQSVTISEIPGEQQHDIIQKEGYPLRISFIGKAIQGRKNDLKIVVSNLSSIDYTQVSIRLLKIPAGISLSRTKWDFPIQANSRLRLPITLRATKASMFEIPLQASFIPGSDSRYLRATVRLKVEPPPTKTIVEVIFL